MANIDESKNLSLILRVKRRSHVDPADALGEFPLHPQVFIPRAPHVGNVNVLYDVA